jgi:hypothetical protein
MPSGVEKVEPDAPVWSVIAIALIVVGAVFYLWKTQPQTFAQPVTHIPSSVSLTLDQGNLVSLRFTDETGSYVCGPAPHGVTCKKAGL